MTDLVTLAGGRTRVAIAPEYGGRIAQIEIATDGGWTRLLHDDTATPAAERNPLLWGSYLMAPWPNRIEHGVFVFDGRTYTLPITHETHAMHGVGFARGWTVDRANESSCELSLALGETAWPFGGRIVQRIAVSDDAVRQAVEVHTDEARFPAGAGWHPWFLRQAGGSDDVRVSIDASEVYELDGMIPTGELRAVNADEDWRRGPFVGDRRLDTCYRDVRGPMRLTWDRFQLTLTSSENATHGVVYTAPHGVCVEPQTCAINAFNLDERGLPGTGTAIVEPDSPLVVTTEWRWRAL
jgi:galactose mutarotase-like enzyme